ASEVKKGLEWGIGVKNYNDVREVDQIEVFEVIEFAKELYLWLQRVEYKEKRVSFKKLYL
ncbi:hypothetical protein, partial [Francisella tularensis]|uniref:hypothetical protein n=1 Tax=Francisella tularensis TaxID=263 RepID=UPI002381BDF4